MDDSNVNVNADGGNDSISDNSYDFSVDLTSASTAAASASHSAVQPPAPNIGMPASSYGITPASVSSEPPPPASVLGKRSASDMGSSVSPSAPFVVISIAGTSPEVFAKRPDQNSYISSVTNAKLQQSDDGSWNLQSGAGSVNTRTIETFPRGSVRIHAHSYSLVHHHPHPSVLLVLFWLPLFSSSSIFNSLLSLHSPLTSYRRRPRSSR